MDVTPKIRDSPGQSIGLGSGLGDRMRVMCYDEVAGPVAQSAEARDLKSRKCGFESHQGQWTAMGDPRSDRPVDAGRGVVTICGVESGSRSRSPAPPD